MTDLNTTTLPPALRKALELLIDPPADPDVSKGYLDLLGAASGQESAPSKGVIQAIWTSPVVATIYDTQQALVRRLLGVLRLPIEWLNISAGATVLDVGCGPASITASLAHAVGPRAWSWASTCPRRCCRGRRAPSGAAGRLFAG
ncbi:putative methyltransferase type 11 [Mycobacterium xenopi 3993]|nr:putative methyltransferase type 11 [Mycobacterium xenopi 3993]